MPFDRRKLHTLVLTLTSSIVLAAAASPAYADGGRGGDGFSSGGTPAAGGAGGGEGASGQSGSPYDHYDADAGGGGGGGGAGGGAGGSGGSAMNNGGGAAGQDGASSTTFVFQGAGGGGGGNGGVHGGTLSGNQSNIGDRVGAAGGAAGNGGNTSNSGSMAGGGGGGGAGGYGLVTTGGLSAITLAGSGSATGGDGGNGGRGGNATGGSSRGGNGGSGGDGGVGINFTVTADFLFNRRTVLGGNGGSGGAGGNSSGYDGGTGGNGGDGGAGVRFDATNGALTNNAGGLIQGGNGGIGGAGGNGNSAGSAGLGGVGGAGVIGAGLSIINGGSIVGGLGADGTRADAITFTGGNNYLRLLETSSLTGNIGITAAGSVVSFDQRSDITLANVITGLGGISMATLAEKLTLTGDNTYTGGTTINSGRVLQIGAGGTTGSILGDVANGGTLIFDRSDDVIFQGAITGAGGIIQNGAGTLRLTGTNTYSGGTTIALNSALHIGNGGTTGSITGNVVNDGSLSFNRVLDVTFDGAISGTGDVIKYGADVLTLTGASSYSGATGVRAGTLLQGAAGAFSANSSYDVNFNAALDIGNYDTTIGSLSGNGQVRLGGHTLTVGGNNDYGSFGGSISNGNLVKVGSDELQLWGSVTNIATMRVDGGLLSVDSDASSTAVTVNAGGTLGGYGTVGATTINGGTLSPGGYITTLTVQGNLSFTAASTYMVEIDPREADRVNVIGTANLGGATVTATFMPAGMQTRQAGVSLRAIPIANVYVAKQYTILNATGGLGGTTFASLVNTDLPSGFRSTLSYDANNVYLDLALAFGLPGGLAGNQQAVGDALTGFFNRTGGIPAVFGTLDGAQLTQISGETATGSQQTSFDAVNIFMTQMTDPFAAGRSDGAPGAIPYADDAMAYAAPKRSPTDAFASMHRKAPALAPQERWNVWAAGFGGSQTTDGNTAMGSNNSRSSIYGMAVGADYWLSPFTVAGLSMAGGGTNFSVNGGGTGRSDLFQFGGFIRHNVGSAYITAAAAYGWQDITTDRVVTSGGFDQLRANFNANSYSGRVEVGNRFVAPWIGGIGLTPYAAFQVTAFDLPSYAESVVAGSNTFALAYAGKTAISPRSELGLRTDKSFAVNDAILTLRGRAAWAHDTNRDRSASATFQSLPGASFIVNGASLAKHTALTSASAELKWMNGWSVAGTFEGEFSDVTRSYAGKGVVRYAW